MMKNHTKLVLALTITVVLVGIALAVWRIERPTRIANKFAGNLFHERYEDAALMLRAPSTIKMAPDGSVTLVDCTEKSTTVPASKLPFKAGGGKPDRTSDFSMTALGKSTNGALDSPPVIIYLSIDGGKLRIVRVDSL